MRGVRALRTPSGLCIVKTMLLSAGDVALAGGLRSLFWLSLLRAAFSGCWRSLRRKRSWPPDMPLVLFFYNQSLLRFFGPKKVCTARKVFKKSKKSLHGIFGFPGTLFWAPAGGSDAGVRAWCKVYVSFNAESGLCIVKVQSKSTPVAAECGHKKASWRSGLGVTLAGAQTESQTPSWALWGLV